MASEKKVWVSAGPSPVTIAMAVRPLAMSIGRGTLVMKTGEIGVSLIQGRCQLMLEPGARSQVVWKTEAGKGPQFQEATGEKGFGRRTLVLPAKLVS